MNARPKPESIRDEAHASEVLAAWRSMNQPLTAFCRERNLSYSSVYRWRRVLDIKVPASLEVKVVGSSFGLRIRPSDGDATELALGQVVVERQAGVVDEARGRVPVAARVRHGLADGRLGQLLLGLLVEPVPEGRQHRRRPLAARGRQVEATGNTRVAGRGVRACGTDIAGVGERGR